MAVVTLAEVKTLKQITVSTYDTLITTLIPIVQNEINDICHNYFLSSSVEYEADTIAFLDTDPDTITDSAELFVDSNFADGMEIYVSGSINNDGYYTVDTAAAGTLTLASANTLIAEAAGETITINRVIWPQALKLVSANMIWQQVSRGQNPGFKSERLGDYSYTLDTGSGSGGFAGYSAESIAGLRPYIKVVYK